MCWFVSLSSRTFRLQLKPDAAGFSEDFTVVTEEGLTAADLSHIYSGTLAGVFEREILETSVKLNFLAFHHIVVLDVFVLVKR